MNYAHEIIVLLTSSHCSVVGDICLLVSCIIIDFMKSSFHNALIDGISCALKLVNTQ